MPKQYDEDLTRQLPSSVIAEQSLLGCIIIDPQTLSEVAGEIQESDFYLIDHAHIYAAMKRLFNENHEIDPVTLIDTLVKNGVYNKERSQDYILTLSEIVPNAMNIKDYARLRKRVRSVSSSRRQDTSPRTPLPKTIRSQAFSTLRRTEYTR